jgi:glutamate racemase
MLGIFDSGVGGLTVVRELLERHPRAAFTYLGDTARSPYGNKSPENIIRYSLEDAAFLIREGASALVVACNTASSYSMRYLSRRFADTPIFEVVTPAIDRALQVTHGRIGVIGTRATIRTHVYRSRLLDAKPSLEVMELACPLLVPLVEEGWLENPETGSVIAHYLDPLIRRGIDTLILGCTHYPLLKKRIERYVGADIRVIDSAGALVSDIERRAPELLDRGGAQRYCFSDDNSNTEAIVQSWLRRSVHCETVHVPPLRARGA